jgi:hypothetical protein
MKANRLSSVQVSLYSMNPAVHDSITKLPGSFEKTMDGILKLIENDIPLQISCSTMKQNKGDYVDVLNWAQGHKVRAITGYIMMARYDHSTGNLDCLHSLFMYTRENHVPVLIHTGEDDFERPAFFSLFFSQYPQVKCILAHCRLCRFLWPLTRYAVTEHGVPDDGNALGDDKRCKKPVSLKSGHSYLG